MSEITGIEWTDATWNPIRGVKGKWSCVKVSPGCANCYAEAMNVRFGGPRYTVGADGLRLDEKILTEPLRWKKPRRVFVCSMTDLFEERVKDEWIESVWTTMGRSPNHTFQVLTKRPDRMRRFVEANLGCTLPNVWLGVSLEDQERADGRIPLLLQTPATVHFVSAEPLLGPVDGLPFRGYCVGHMLTHDCCRRLDWVIVGGESGTGARPCDLSWIRTIVQQCRSVGVSCFVKQIGRRVIGEADSANRWIFPGGGEWMPPIIGPQAGKRPPGAIGFVPWHPKGGDTAEWPEDLRVREFPA